MYLSEMRHPGEREEESRITDLLLSLMDCTVTEGPASVVEADTTGRDPRLEVAAIAVQKSSHLPLLIRKNVFG